MKGKKERRGKRGKYGGKKEMVEGKRKQFVPGPVEYRKQKRAERKITQDSMVIVHTSLQEVLECRTVSFVGDRQMCERIKEKNRMQGKNKVCHGFV